MEIIQPVADAFVSGVAIFALVFTAFLFVVSMAYYVSVLMDAPTS